jgi:hypothetical protein
MTARRPHGAKAGVAGKLPLSTPQESLTANFFFLSHGLQNEDPSHRLHPTCLRIDLHGMNQRNHC